MKLTPEQERELAAYPAYSCGECGQPLTKVYCGRCDEFYNAGHSRGCSRRHLALVAQRDALREALEEIAHGFSFGSVHLQEIARAALESPK